MNNELIVRITRIWTHKVVPIVGAFMFGFLIGGMIVISGQARAEPSDEPGWDSMACFELIEGKMKPVPCPRQEEAKAQIKPYTVTWSMMEAESIPCSHTWIDDYGRTQRHWGCLVAHFKWTGPYTGRRDFESIDKAIAFIEEKQNKWGFPQRCYGFKILFGKNEMIFLDPKKEIHGIADVDSQTGVTWYSGTTIWEKEDSGTTPHQWPPPMPLRNVR